MCAPSVDHSLRCCSWTHFGVPFFAVSPLPAAVAADSSKCPRAFPASSPACARRSFSRLAPPGCMLACHHAQLACGVVPSLPVQHLSMCAAPSSSRINVAQPQAWWCAACADAPCAGAGGMLEGRGVGCPMIRLVCVCSVLLWQQPGIRALHAAVCRFKGRVLLVEKCVVRQESYAALQCTHQAPSNML
jgi:hypothetical protein